MSLVRFWLQAPDEAPPEGGAFTATRPRRLLPTAQQGLEPPQQAGRRGLGEGEGLDPSVSAIEGGGGFGDAPEGPSVRLAPSTPSGSPSPSPCDGEETEVPSRPLHLFDPPQPVEALAGLPDSPPRRFRWRPERRVRSLLRRQLSSCKVKWQASY